MSERFLKPIFPIWAIEGILTGSLNLVPLELTEWLGIFSIVVSGVLLPYVAGARFKNAGSRKTIALLGAVSISAVTLIVAGVLYFSNGFEREVFMGL